MFGKKHGRRSTNPLFVIFRLFLSVTMFILLLAGVYSAYKHFSGLDPLKLDPQATIRQLLGAKTPQQFLAILSSLKINTGSLKNNPPKIIRSSVENTFKAPNSPKLEFKFAAVADSHNDNVNLRRAINQIKQTYPDISFIIGLGDYTDVGTIDELRKAKDEFDSAGFRYFLIPGDHDFWDCRNRGLLPNCNFKEVFGPTYQAFAFDNFRLILLNNSDNYSGFDEDQLKWLADQLDQAKNSSEAGIYIFVHEPLFHPSSDHFMGRVTPNLKLQAKSLIYQLKSAKVKRIFAGDIHYFSEYEEPETKLPMVTVGAIGSDRNPQAPRFSVVSVFEDGSTKVEDVEVR